MAPIFTVANMIKILYPKLVSICNVTFDNTKSIQKSNQNQPLIHPNLKKNTTHTPKPLRRTRHRQPVVPCPGREDIGHIHPRQRSPTHRVEAHVDIQERGHRPRCWSRGGRCRVRRVGLEDGADDVEEGAHAHRGDDKGSAAAESFDTEKDEEGCGDELWRRVQ